MRPRFAVVVAMLALGNALASVCLARPIVPREEVREALARAWEDHGPAGSEIEVRVLPNLLGDDACPCELAVEIPDDAARPGPRILGVSCLVAGRSISRGLASVVVRSELAVWVSPVNFVKGAQFTSADLQSNALIVEREPRHLFAPQVGARYRIVRDVPAGEPLRAADVRRVPDVAPGDLVTLVASAGAARVGVEGKVRRGGSVGDLILVHNPVSGALVRATLIDVATATLVEIPAAFRRERKMR
jgi:flagella basal body P-ring formation protein FlgA